jgi:nicotinamidase/pyrazinamidase
MASVTASAIRTDDALIVVDVQVDFLPGGNLAVPRGQEVIEPLNRVIAAFVRSRRPVFATRDWHPADHCSFRAQGGIWPPHCVAGSAGAAFAADLALPPDTCVISKATAAEREAYSGFESTDLAQRLRDLGVKRVFVGGLATDYCVLNTVRDARRLEFDVALLSDCVRAAEVNEGDGARALAEMHALGAKSTNAAELA